MGGQILLTIGLTILLMGIIDLFTEWYDLYLKRRGLEKKLRLYLKRLTWVILAFVLWEYFIARHDITEISSSHFLFTLFIASFYRLIASFRRNSGKKQIGRNDHE